MVLYARRIKWIQSFVSILRKGKSLNSGDSRIIRLNIPLYSLYDGLRRCSFVFRNISAATPKVSVSVDL